MKPLNENAFSFKQISRQIMPGIMLFIFLWVWIPNAYNEPGHEPTISIEEEVSESIIDSIKNPAYGLVMVKFPIELTTPVSLHSTNTI